MFLVGVLLFVAAEIAAFVVVAQHVGLLGALGLLILVSAVGPFIVRRVGLGVLADVRDSVARGEVPTRALLDGLVVFIGGAMICVPGFVSDALGLLLMVGPLRGLVIRTAGYRLARRVPTIRIGRPVAADSRYGAVDVDSSPAGTPPSRSLGPGDETGPR